ncbi:MAG: reverse transcriptase domain-containing protein [Bacteroidales bacterium]|jgi:RNA-directed DNA polymerase|nr:reverse transcriptase domain-containing protein [Bacteroidales bacterium]
MRNEESIKTKFLGAKSPQALADLLDISLERLNYLSFIMPDSARYTSMTLKKKCGEDRNIYIPEASLKIVQKRLYRLLLNVYTAKQSTFGFVPGKNIVQNARRHERKKNILNIDIKDFFPSINFGRVRGLLIAKPYELQPNIATIVSQICCFNNQLPQGAPTSPIISNMICSKLDHDLISLARSNKCTYTRYADDITFSTNLYTMPEDILKDNNISGLELGDKLLSIFKNNGFDINPKKTRASTKYRRQEVTGITVNQFLNVRRTYIRQIRAMLNAWEKYGLELSEKKYNELHIRNMISSNHSVSFKHVIKGKIDYLGAVRGKNDYLYLKLLFRLKALAPDLVRNPIFINQLDGNKIYIMTEGKTDWKHMENALNRFKEKGLYPTLNIEFIKKYPDRWPEGNEALLTWCKHESLIPNKDLRIFIFDNDDEKKNSEIKQGGKWFKNWGNNVYSLALPVPHHRAETPLVCIELYYKNDDLLTEDEYGRRIYLTREFISKSGHLENNHTVSCRSNKIQRQNPLKIEVVDKDVRTATGKSIGLSKSDFAEYVYTGKKNFDNFNLDSFRLLFDEISLIKLEAFKQTDKNVIQRFFRKFSLK